MSPLQFQAMYIYRRKILLEEGVIHMGVVSGCSWGGCGVSGCSWGGCGVSGCNWGGCGISGCNWGGCGKWVQLGWVWKVGVVSGAVGVGGKLLQLTWVE